MRTTAPRPAVKTADRQARRVVTRMLRATDRLISVAEELRAARRELTRLSDEEPVR